MKSHYLLALFLLPILTIQAQSLNPSFENWTILQNQITLNGTATIQGITADYEIDDPQFNYNEIVNWSSLNQLTGSESITYPSTGITLVELVTESSDAVDGVKSVKLESKAVEITAQITIFGQTNSYSVTNTAPGLLVSGVFDLDESAFAEQLLNGTNLNSLNPFTYEGTGQSIDFQALNLKGAYKYTSVGGDSAMLVSGLIKDRVVIAYVIKRLPAASVWTNFQLNYEYLSCTMPDTIISVFCSSNLDADFNNGVFTTINSSYTGVSGSILRLDNLTMDTLDLNSFPPIAITDSSTIFDTEVAVVDVTANDDFCGAALPMPVILTNVSNGTVVVLITGEYEYTPNVGFSGVDNLVYYVCNDSSLCDTASWYISVNPIPLCIPVDDFRSLTANSSSVFDATTNDMDCGNVPSLFTLPVNGVANVESNGFISYSPLNGFLGIDSLTYTLCSNVNTSQCATAKVYYEIVTGIKDIASYRITIAPNPANEQVTISVNTNEGTVVSVFNLLGQEFLNTSFKKTISIDVRNYPEGGYVVRMENASGVATRKLVIRR
jgi:hypothetical protein